MNELLNIHAELFLIKKFFGAVKTCLKKNRFELKKKKKKKNNFVSKSFLKNLAI